MKDNSTAQLLPCPFCGVSLERCPPRDDGTPVARHPGEKGCALVGLYFDDKHWNTRAPVSQDAAQLVERLRCAAFGSDDESIILEAANAIEALTRPQPSTSSVEAVLHKLIDAARMYEASCRLGGKDQEFASLKLDEAKSAALTALPSPEREPMREALEEARKVIGLTERDWIVPKERLVAAIATIDAALAPPTAHSEKA